MHFKQMFYMFRISDRRKHNTVQGDTDLEAEDLAFNPGMFI